MGSREDTIQFLETELARSKGVLASLESGTVRSGEKPAGGAERTDITQGEIGRLKAVITEYKRLIDQSRAEGGNWRGPPTGIMSGP